MIRRRLHRHSRSSLLWTLFFTLLSLGGLIASMETLHPELFDGEQVERMRLLNRLLADEPRKSNLLIASGSSRLAMAFQPEKLRPLHGPEGCEVLAFNYSHFGASPWMTLVE